MSSTALTAAAAARAGLRRVFWRVHFWAGLVTAPIVLFAAATGLVYVFAPQIESRVHAHLDTVPIGAVTQALDIQWAAAVAGAPGWMPRSIVPGTLPGQTTQVVLAAPTSDANHKGAAPTNHGHGLPRHRIVYVNPYTAEVVGSLAEMGRFKTWSKKLHSSMLQGDAWRWPIELSASWMLLMLATGVTMWWPRSRANGGPRWRAVIPVLGRGRRTWRDMHTSIGLLMSGLLMVVLVTGLTWSRHAGANFRAAQEAIGQASPKLPGTLRSQAAALPVGGEARVSLQSLWDAARAETAQSGAVPLPLQFTAPRASGDVWRMDTLAGDQPTRRLTLAFDATTGEVLHRTGWKEMPLLAKATALGIPLHRGEFGLWNQGLLALVALSAAFSVLSGLVMWWKRRPARGLAVPAVTAAQVRAVPWWLWAVGMGLTLTMPVFGISVALFALLEVMFAARHARRPASMA